MGDFVYMVKDGNGGLRPAHKGEEGAAVDAWPLDKVREAFRRAGEGAPSGGSCAAGSSAAAVQPYMEPGHRGACAPRGQGVGFFGIHVNTTAGTTETSTSVSPQRPVRVTQLFSYGTDIAAWQLNTLRVNQDVLKHAGTAPLSIFSPFARYPVEFDWDLTTADTVTIGTSQYVSITSGRMMVAGANCFDSGRGLDWPCSPVSKAGSRQIILGLGTASPVENAVSTATLSDTPDSPVRLGRLMLAGVINGVSPSVTPRVGETGANGQQALEFIDVTQVDRSTVTIWTTVPTNGAIPGAAFSAEAGGVFFPDVDVAQADTLRVTLQNRAAAATGTLTNDMTVIGAFVGCELLGC